MKHLYSQLTKHFYQSTLNSQEMNHLLSQLIKHFYQSTLNSQEMNHLLSQLIKHFYQSTLNSQEMNHLLSQLTKHFYQSTLNSQEMILWFFKLYIYCHFMVYGQVYIVWMVDIFYFKNSTFIAPSTADLMCFQQRSKSNTFL